MKQPSAKQRDFFGIADPLPRGLVYVPAFITEAEEVALLGEITGLALHEAPYKSYRAKRRIMSYGGEYDFSANRLLPGSPVPLFLMPLRAKVAAWCGMPAEEFAHALVTEYRPGVQLGWHRDVPQFAVIVGISLAGSARMRFRAYPPRTNKREGAFALDLEPRSVYLMRDDARWRWQHSIAPTKRLRYSVTFRTYRNK